MKKSLLVYCTFGNIYAEIVVMANNETQAVRKAVKIFKRDNKIASNFINAHC